MQLPIGFLRLGLVDCEFFFQYLIKAKKKPLALRWPTPACQIYKNDVFN